MDFLFRFLPWFCVMRSHGGVQTRPEGFEPAPQWDVLAFSTVAALAFFAFVIVGIIRNFDAVHGPHSIGRGDRASGSRADAVRSGIARATFLGIAIGLGTLAAYIVATACVIIDLLQVNAQGAVLVGVTWQLVYAKLVSQMTDQAGTLSPSMRTAQRRQIESDELEET